MKLIPDFPCAEPDLAKPIEIAEEKPKQMWTNPTTWGVMNKYDGIRCLMTENHGGFTKTVSRNDKPLGGHNIKDIKQIWHRLCEEQPELKNVILDREVYAYWEETDFDRLSGMVRKTSAHSTGWEDLYYIIFDCFWIHRPDFRFNERMLKLSEIIKDAYKSFGRTTTNARERALIQFATDPYRSNRSIHEGEITNDKWFNPITIPMIQSLLGGRIHTDVDFTVPAINCSADYISDILEPYIGPIASAYTVSDALLHALKTAESIDLEGIIVRDVNKSYNCGRTGSNLYKLKSFEDDEFLIVGYEEAMGKDYGTPVWVCDTHDGSRQFKVRPMATDAAKRKMWADRDDIVGSQLTVKFQELTKYGVPRFPSGVGIRDYE
jgi:ATP-dependent DNA ligase